MSTIAQPPKDSFYGGQVPDQSATVGVDFPSDILWDDNSNILWDDNSDIEWSNTQLINPDKSFAFTSPKTEFTGEAD